MQSHRSAYATRTFDVRHQLDSALRQSVLVFQARDLVRKTLHLFGFGYFRHQDDFRLRGDHFGKVLQAIGLQRVDTHRGQNTGVAPRLVGVARQRTRLRPLQRRDRVFQLLNNDVGIEFARGCVRRFVIATNEQP